MCVPVGGGDGGRVLSLALSFTCVLLVPAVRFIGFADLSSCALCGSSGFDLVSLWDSGNTLD